MSSNKTFDYFAYLCQETGHYYYYNTTTKNVTYNFPDDGFIFNPITKERLYIPPGNWKPDYEPGTKIIGKNTDFPPYKKVKSIIEVPDFVSSFRKNKPKIPTKMDVSNLSSRFNRETFLKSIEQFQVPDYAKKFFKKRRRMIFFKNIPPEDSVHFRMKPISSPLLKSLPKSLHKIAIQCFNYILGFIGIQNDKTPAEYAHYLVSELYANTPLRDEIYVYLICQTTDVNSEEYCAKAWQLFLIIASLFPSSRDLEVWVLSHISMVAMRQPYEGIADIAQFTYIRFETRCSLNKERKLTSDISIISIADELYTTTAQFGVSLYEMMWQQKEIFPSLRIPYLLYYLTKLIVAKGGYNCEGLFRIPGNSRVIKQMADAADNSLDTIKDGDINDIASLFKMWLRELPNSIIPEKYLLDFIQSYEDDKLIEFIKTIPQTHFYSLAYLIGFLQECATQENTTKMGANNLAIVFGPNIYSTSESSPEKLQDYNRLTTDALRWLIDNFNTRSYYPIHL
ncbi:RhoGAP domain containing protein [Tritrichomonas foetus]|uniref:RhoGAP domain containing protein n=1 Tax=Tritrichomonas foetus TaxID=1144522 RepID=A0A1J4L059_9EUKA|nr:RhoGAP domain containing protein [Tritrichomonas foetus]|eukprot:OHT15316.1 RhoGAP domain containing protein [Tritrichomonas foetus]